MSAIRYTQVFLNLCKNIEINMNVNVVISTLKKNFIEAQKHPIDLNNSPKHQ